MEVRHNSVSQYVKIIIQTYIIFPDAAKRRQLPAWIREGLEKMEREKQKKIDRERQIKEREAYLQKKREEEENAISELEKNSGQLVIPKKSKFVSILCSFVGVIVCLFTGNKNVLSGCLSADFQATVRISV
jgi:hypothetical protein